MMEFVSWDDYSPYMKKTNVPNHQPDKMVYKYCVLKYFEMGLHKSDDLLTCNWSWAIAGNGTG